MLCFLALVAISICCDCLDVYILFLAASFHPQLCPCWFNARVGMGDESGKIVASFVPAVLLSFSKCREGSVPKGGVGLVRKPDKTT